MAEEKSHVQAVLFNKSQWKPKEARKWLKDNGYKSSNLVTTDTYLRFRQKAPNKKKYNYRTKGVGKGIVFIIGFPKE